MASSASSKLLGNSLAIRQQIPYSGPDRRRASRVPLQWTIYVTCDGDPRHCRTKTRDISPVGFYCTVDRLIELGEELKCDIAVPLHNPSCASDVVYLRCRAEAVRVEKLGAGGACGVAFRIREYRIIPICTNGLEVSPEISRKVSDPRD
jgi:hypothetical protein